MRGVRGKSTRNKLVIRVANRSRTACSICKAMQSDLVAGLPLGRDLISHNLLSASECFGDSEHDPGSAADTFHSLQEALGQQEGLSTASQQLQNAFIPACKALQQTLISGWPDAGLLRNFSAFLANAALQFACPDDIDHMDYPEATCINSLLVCLWMVCQLLGTLDEVHQLKLDKQHISTAMCLCVSLNSF